MPVTAGGPSRPRWLIPTAIAVAVILLIGAVVVLTGDDDNNDASSTTQTTTAATGEIFLQPIGDNGPDPFGASVAAATPKSTIPPVRPSTPGTTTGGGAVAITSVSGGTPGLYGGTLNQQSCDKEKMIDYLEANPAKAAAWAGAQGITVANLRLYIDSLTSVLLRSDTRVTNHGYLDGRATPYQAVLQAGTAVLVDNQGVPRARCACGNPLTPPQPVPTTPTYTGSPWTGFNPASITVINKSTTIIKIITIIDVRTGERFGRPVGPNAGPDVTPGTTPRTTPPITPATTPYTTPPATFPPYTNPPLTSPPTTAGPSGVFTLVDSSHTVAELPNAWTVNRAAGTAVVSLPPNKGEYFWTVPQTIDPAGTQISWGGTVTGNVHVLISPRGENLTFNTTDLEASVTSGSGSKSAIITVPTAVSEVKLMYGMGFSVNVVYTYRR
jgi:hypothetical protein